MLQLGKAGRCAKDSFQLVRAFFLDRGFLLQTGVWGELSDFSFVVLFPLGLWSKQCLLFVGRAPFLWTR